MAPPNLEILAYEETSLGPLCLRRRRLLADPDTVVTEVTLNHEFLMSSLNTDSERAIAGRSVSLHGGANLRVLVGGFGLGYTAWELLQSPAVATVEVVEYLPQVLNWFRDGLIPLAESLHASEKLELQAGDIYRRLWEEPKTLFDLIVIDVDHSPADQLGEVEHRFYSVTGLQRAKRHLAEEGVLAVWSYAEDSDFATALRATFTQVVVEPVRTFNRLVNHEQTDWLFFATDEVRTVRRASAGEEI